MTRPRDFNDILSRLPGARQSGKKATAPCPLTGHTTPADHVSVEDAGDKAIITCHGGRHTYSDFCQVWGFDSLTYSPNGNGHEAKIIAEYDYTDTDGKLLYQVVRYEPKDFKQRRPNGSGGWVWSLKGITPVLYRLSEVISALKEGRTVYITEGEKDADNLVKLGLSATTNSGGAEKWRPEYSEALRDASVVILPDRDDPGQRHAAKVAAFLQGRVKSIKIVELSDKDSHHVKDVSDWLAAGGTRAELETLVSTALEYKPKESSDISLVCMADVVAEKVAWLWYPYIPLGKVTLLEGDPGLGKSWLTLAIATAISLGKGLPGTEATQPAKVVLASAEDGLGDTIKPRLDAMGANVRNVHAIKGALDFGNGGLAILEVYIEQVRPALVIVDPLVAYIGAGVDMHRANETRTVMAKLADIAEKRGCAILALRHLTKGGTLKPIYRGVGSIDFAAACRSILMAGCDPENEQKRGIVQIKSNLAPMGRAVGYELRDDNFYWTGVSDLTAAKIMAPEDSGEGKSVRDEASDFLRDELADGPVEGKQVYSDARDMGISERTLNRAKSELEIVTKRQGEIGKRGGGKWTWELPNSGEQSINIATQNRGNLNQLSYEKEKTVGNVNQVGNVNNTPENTTEAVLGMSVEKAIELWRSEGAPIIHLGPGENCSNLETLLSNRNIKPQHLEVVRAWLEEHKGGGKQ